MSFDIASAALWVFPLLMALVFHEWAHGYAAFRLGDDTAERLGRLTLNPLAHIDPMGTVLSPGFLFLVGSPFLFGYARPVPVSWNRLRSPARDMVWVAVAGPAMNLALALGCTVVLGLLGPEALVRAQYGIGTGAGFDMSTPLAIMLLRGVLINVVLAVFNLLPIPPLDGGRVAVGLLPRNLAWPLAQVEPYGMLVVVMLLMTGMLGSILGPAVHGVLGVLDWFL
jgi:Zn-dependent protease